MSNVQREKYLALMDEIETTEDLIENLEAEAKVAEDSPNPEDAPTVREEVKALQEKLAAQKAELARISNGCGSPRS